MIAILLSFLAVLSITYANKSIYDFSVQDIDGNTVSMGKYKGKFLLIINVASQCGYTDSNYKALQALYEKYDRLEIAAFPCNQFGRQEPWAEGQIKKWAKENYSVTFDMYSKVDVKGDQMSALFRFLVESDTNNNQQIEWNFDGKFLVNQNGVIVKRWNNKTPLSVLDSFVGRALPKKEL